MVSVIDISPSAFQAQMELVLAKASADKYGRSAAIFIELLPMLGIESVQELPPDTLIRFANYLIAKGLKPNTLKIQIASIRRYLRWLDTKGVPCPRFHIPELQKEKRRIRGILPADMVQQYLDLTESFTKPAIKAAVQLAPFTGLRVSEHVNLKLENISIQKLKMRSGAVKSCYMLQVIGKGGDEKLVPVLDEGSIILSKYLKGWRKSMKGSWVFPIDKKGKHPISTRTFRDYVQKLCITLGIHMTPHTLRRTYGRMLFRRGVDPAVIAKIFGHKKLDTLLQHYLALDEQDIMRSVYGDL